MKITNVKTLFTIPEKPKLATLMLASLFLGFHSFGQVPSPVPSGLSESMRVNLYQLSSGGTTTLADGNLTNYNDAYSNGLDDDAPKMNNFGENFSIMRSGTRLAIEQRMLINYTDTTFFNMWNMGQRSYRLVIITYNLEHPGLLGFLEDAFLGTSTPLLLNSTNTYDFSVNSSAGSNAIGRFRIIFRNPSLAPLAATFTSFTGKLNGKKVDLLWNINNEVAMREYVVERSFNRVNYTSIQSLSPENSPGSKSYTSSDPGFVKGDNYYRIRAVGLNGEVSYSTILKISTGNATEINVYPNPVIAKKLNISITGALAGRYQMSLYNSAGTAMPLNRIESSGGSLNQSVKLPATLAPGIYRLRVIAPDQSETIKTISVQ
jgi:hypothetical protein